MVSVDFVQVVNRHRSDLGDLSDLVESIEADGLLHPIVLTEQGRLIAGQRRLEACRKLGWSEIPATFVTSATDAAALLRMERDENTCRKDMAPSERVSLGRALEELERPKARARQGTRTDLQLPDRANTKSDGVGLVREVVGDAIGMGGSTYMKAKALVTAAEDGDEQAQAGVAQMDDTGKVTPAYDGWKQGTVAKPARRNLPQAERAEQIRRLAADGNTSHQIASKIGVGVDNVRRIVAAVGIDVAADRVVRNSRHIDSTRVVEQTIDALAGLATGVELVDFDDLDLAQTRHWADSLAQSFRVLNRFHRQIKEMAQ